MVLWGFFYVKMSRPFLGRGLVHGWSLVLAVELLLCDLVPTHPHLSLDWDFPSWVWLHLWAASTLTQAGQTGISRGGPNRRIREGGAAQG